MRISKPIPAGPDASAGVSPVRFWRPKGNLTKLQVSLLVLVVVVPFLMVAIRILALPGVMGSGVVLDEIRLIGNTLTETFSLSAIIPAMRGRIFYLLFIPTCALLAVFVRLTLGIRVLGFRSILISLAFHASGVLPSLVLIVVALSFIAILRPRLKHMRLPYYSRVSVILCVVAVMMVVALLAGYWFQKESMWSVTFFPVIVLALLAEGIARTVEREGTRSASWRTFTTVSLAFVVASMSRLLPAKELLLEFPELCLVQIAAILLVSEFMDLRLLQEWDSERSGLALPHLFSGRRALKVAVVRNRSKANVIARLGRDCPEKYGRRSVQRIINALRDGGHEVRIFEGDLSLLAGLREFIPPHSRTGQPGGLVFNLAYGIQGDARYTHVPAMLEMAGIAYTSANPLGHSLALDKVVAKVLMQSAGIPTPEFCVMVDPKDDIGGLKYPLIVKPRHESSSFGLAIVKNRRELEKAVENVVGPYKQGALVEEFIEGREVNAALIGNNPVECLPLVEIDFRGREDTALTHEDKFKTKDGEPQKICPAPLDDDLAQRIRDISVACFLACYCRDYARVDVRISESGEPYVLEINSIATLGWTGSYVTAATAAGYSFTEIICRIVDVARERYRTDGASQLIGLPATVARAAGVEEAPALPEAEAPPAMVPAAATPMAATAAADAVDEEGERCGSEGDAQPMVLPASVSEDLGVDGSPSREEQEAEVPPALVPAAATPYLAAEATHFVEVTLGRYGSEGASQLMGLSETVAGALRGNGASGNQGAEVPPTMVPAAATPCPATEATHTAEVALGRYGSEGASQLMGLPETVAGALRANEAPAHPEAEVPPTMVPEAATPCSTIGGTQSDPSLRDAFLLLSPPFPMTSSEGDGMVTRRMSAASRSAARGPPCDPEPRAPPTSSGTTSARLTCSPDTADQVRSTTDVP